jgi:outer membrane protein insertion porin family
MKGLRISPEGRNVLGFRLQASYVQGFGGDVAPPTNRIFTGGENDLRGFDVRTATPYAYIPTRVNITLTNPDGSPVPKDPQNPSTGNIQIPIPVYGIVSVGGDTSVTSNLEYRVPIAGPVTFAFFNDFGIDVAARESQLKQSVEGIDLLNSPLYGCPVYNNGACQGGKQVSFDRIIRPIDHTNLVPRMSTGAELQVILPIVNAPFRLYYAFNPMRLEHQIPGKTLITRDMFPAGGAGDFTYTEAIQGYGSYYQFREPRKTFRLTVSTTF